MAEPTVHGPSARASRGVHARRGGVPRLLLVVLGVVGALGIGGVALLAGGAGSAEAPAPGSRLDVVAATRTSFDITTTAMGELRARNQIEIRNRLESESTVVEIVPEGTRVRKGDLLAKLNAESIQTKIEEESLQIENAKATLVEANEAYEIQVSENDSSLRDAQLKLDLAKLDLQKWREGEDVSKKQELVHALDRARKDEERLREKYEKSKQLYEKQFYSKDQLRQDQLAWEQAVASLEKAQLDKDVYERFQYPKDLRQKESEVEEAQAQLERVNRQNASRLASKEAARANARQSLTLRETKQAKYMEQLRAATIEAPSDGLVVYGTSLENARWGNDDGPLQVGSRVFPNQLLMVLPDTSEMIAQVRVHESLAGRLRPGQPAAVKVDAVGGKRFTGRVESIGILAEQTSRWMDPNLREYSVRVGLELPAGSGELGVPEAAPATAAGHGLKPSMRCEAEIMLGRSEDVLAVPIQAVMNEGMLRYVHVADGSGRFSRRPVLLGQRSDRFAEIRAGLQAGDRVLIRRPEAGEVVNQPWDKQQLAAVGLEVNDRGEITPVGGSGGSEAGAPRRGGRGGPVAVKPGEASAEKAGGPRGGGEPATAAPGADGGSAGTPAPRLGT